MYCRIAFAAKIGTADEIDQPFIARIRRRQKHDGRQLDQRLLASPLFGFEAVFHVDRHLTADDRLQPVIHRLLGKLQGDEEIVGICDGNRRLTVAGRLVEDLLERQCAFEK